MLVNPHCDLLLQQNKIGEEGMRGMSLPRATISPPQLLKWWTRMWAWIERACFAPPPDPDCSLAPKGTTKLWRRNWNGRE